MKYIASLLSLAALLAALAFALSNRQPVTVSLWPLDATAEAPLYLLALGPLVIGLFAGAVVAWFSFLPHRFAARRLRKELSQLQDKVEDLQQTVIPPHAGDDDEDIDLLPPPKKRGLFRGM